MRGGAGGWDRDATLTSRWSSSSRDEEEEDGRLVFVVFVLPPSFVDVIVLDGEEAYPLPSQHPKIQFLNVMSVLNPMYVVSFLI